MTINDMTNLWEAYNKEEDFRLLIIADNENDALLIAKRYAADTGLTENFVITETDTRNTDYDCDYILTAHDNTFAKKRNYSL